MSLLVLGRFIVPDAYFRRRAARRGAMGLTPTTPLMCWQVITFWHIRADCRLRLPRVLRMLKVSVRF